MADNSQSSLSSESMAALIEFIEQARTQGASDEVIFQLLLSQGWSKQQVESAYNIKWINICYSFLGEIGRQGEEIPF
jgi:catabolite regulation protein CreA